MLAGVAVVLGTWFLISSSFVLGVAVHREKTGAELYYWEIFIIALAWPFLLGVAFSKHMDEEVQACIDRWRNGR